MMSSFVFPSCFAVVYIIIHLLVVTASAGHFHVIDEKVAFQIQWPGKQNPISNIEVPRDIARNIVSITTEDEENYQCVLPNLRLEDDTEKNAYKGPSPLVILKPLFAAAICTLKMEQFWTYELCHGHFIRQYHKEVTEDEQKIHREYVLGKFDPTDLLSDTITFEDVESQPIKKVLVDGKEYAYWGLNMTDGTLCDINGRNRFAHVMYICYEGGYNEIHSIKESSTCEYEVIVSSPLLCVLANYRQNSQIRSDINCYAVGDSPIKPRQLLPEEVLMEPSTFHTKMPEDVHLKKDASLRFQDNKLIDDFLNGKYCLQGGTGWWHYEFCYGKKALQFHDDNGKRTSIILGKWDVSSHLLWLSENPHKRPKKGKSDNKQVSHMYTGGSFCEETGKNRQVEVRLKCKDAKAHPNSISMYLLEPKPCEYILPIESPILCPLIASADEYGLT